MGILLVLQKEMTTSLSTLEGSFITNSLTPLVDTIFWTKILSGVTHILCLIFSRYSDSEKTLISSIPEDNSIGFSLIFFTFFLLILKVLKQQNYINISASEVKVLKNKKENFIYSPIVGIWDKKRLSNLEY